MINSNTGFFTFSKITEKLLWLTIGVFGVFPLLSNKFKGLAVILFVFTTILFTWKERSNLKYKLHEFYELFLFSGVFIFYLVSLSYTDNLSQGWRRIETSLSLILMPWACFFLFKTKTVTENHLDKLLLIFFISTSAFASLVIYYFYTIGYYSGDVTLGLSMSWMERKMWFFNQHALYASMFVGIALLFLPYILKKASKYFKLFLIALCCIDVYFLFLLLRKTVLIAVLIAFIIFLFKNKNNVKLLLLMALISVPLIFFFNQPIKKRVGEMFLASTYKQVDQNNSTSLRFAIYNCTINDISQNPILGYGVGDSYDLIMDCLESNYGVKFKEPKKQKKNTHNQFLGIWHYAGIFALLVFLCQLFYYFRRAIKYKNPLYLQLLLFFVIMMLTENILDRQSGIILFTFFINVFYFLSKSESSSNE